MLRNILFLALVFASTSLLAQETIQKKKSTNNTAKIIPVELAIENEEQLSNEIIIVAPDPSASLLYITSKVLPDNIELYDSNGKFIEKSSSNKYVNFGSLNKGNYLLKLHYSGFTAVRKVIKK